MNKLYASLTKMATHSNKYISDPVDDLNPVMDKPTSPMAQ